MPRFDRPLLRLCPRLLSSVVVLLAVPGSTALADEIAELDRSSFLARFQKSDARFEALRARAAAAEGDVGAARALANPIVSLDREEVRVGDERTADQLATLSWSLELSGARGKRIAAARAGVDAAARDSDAQALELVLAGLATFEDAAHVRLRATLLRDSRAELAGMVEVVRRRQARGDVAGADLDRALLELGAHEDLLAEAEQALAEARTEVARLVGRPGGAFDAATSALDMPAEPPPAEDLLAEARSRRADLRAARARVQEAGQRAAAASRGWVPGVSLTGGFKSSDLGERTATGYVIGLGLSLPIFDRGQGVQARADAERRQHAATARALESELVAEVRAARSALVAAIARARRHAQELLPRAAGLVKAAQSSYREGERPLFELLDAYRTARDVRLRDLDLRRAARRAELRLLRAVGRKP